jgi:hypothetical protein
MPILKTGVYGVYDNQPCRKQDPVDTRKGSASSLGSAVYVVNVNVNAILQGTQGGERHGTKQSANARGLSTWKQAPPPHSSDSRNRNDREPTTHVLRLIWMANLSYNQSAIRGPLAEKRRQHQRSAS